MNEIIPRLWLSDWKCAQGSMCSHIITVAIDSPFVGNEHFALVDGPGNSHDLFHSAVSAVVQAHMDGRNVVVHCVAGQSRSAAVVVSVLMALQELDWCHAYNLVIKQKPNVRIHPAFAEFLRT